MTPITQLLLILLITPSYIQELLEAGNWAAADNETLAILLQLAGLENEYKLDVEHLEKISGSDLKTIDQLWVNRQEVEAVA